MCSADQIRKIDYHRHSIMFSPLLLDPKLVRSNIAFPLGWGFVLVISESPFTIFRLSNNGMYGPLKKLCVFLVMGSHKRRDPHSVVCIKMNIWLLKLHLQSNNEKQLVLKNSGVTAPASLPVSAISHPAPLQCVSSQSRDFPRGTCGGTAHVQFVILNLLHLCETLSLILAYGIREVQQWHVFYLCNWMWEHIYTGCTRLYIIFWEGEHFYWVWHVSPKL